MPPKRTFLTCLALLYLVVSMVYITLSEVSTENEGVSTENEGFMALKEYVKTEGARIFFTKTDPPYIMVTEDIKGNPLCHSLPSTHTNDLGFFAPIETVLFRTILHEQCNKLDENGKPPLVVDVGANMGYFTLYAAKMGCRVLAFEPLPRLIEFLKMSIALNRFEDRVTLIHAAASDQEGEVFVQADCNELGLTTVSEQAGSSNIRARKVALSDIVKENVLLLKIDVEGYEDYVFKGMKGFLEKFEVKNIICETKKMGDVALKQQFMDAFMDKQYKLFSYGEDYNGGPTPVPLSQNCPQSKLIPLSKFGEGPSWLPHEDVFYTNQFEELEWTE